MKEKQFEPTVYDVLIQDFDQQDLHGKISDILSKPYLKPLKENQLKSEKRRTGIFYGGGGRGIISLPTWNSSVNPIWVHYLIDTGSPYNYLSKETLKALKADETQNMFSVVINGHACPARLSTNHFSEINILGMNYLLNRSSLLYDFETYKIILTDRNEN